MFGDLGGGQGWRLESIGGEDGGKKEITMWWNTGKKVDSVYTAPELASGETGQISLRRRSLEFKSRRGKSTLDHGICESNGSPEGQDKAYM